MDRILHIPVEELRPGDEIYAHRWETVRSIAVLYDGAAAQHAGGALVSCGSVVATAGTRRSFLYAEHQTVMMKPGPGEWIEAS